MGDREYSVAGSGVSDLRTARRDALKVGLESSWQLHDVLRNDTCMLHVTACGAAQDNGW